MSHKTTILLSDSINDFPRFSATDPRWIFLPFAYPNWLLRRVLL
jgi:hypothetical protein